MWIESQGCEPASLETVLRKSKVVFVVAGVTSENQGFLGAHEFSMMPEGAALVLVSRAGVVDFDAMLEWFPVAFHEPYYASYLREDFDRLFAPGFKPLGASPAYFSKVLSYRREVL